ncbi:MAG: hypothetical protein AB7D39_15430 [Pseudodesulfovibrio sp.]|uniref:hypothetical protein n=1 Tax=Pseudodesulfovibrio sp. TaxID=2035812 RepID=UPI003D0D99B1
MADFTREESNVKFTFSDTDACCTEDIYVKNFHCVAHVDFFTRPDNDTFYLEVKTTAPRMGNKESREKYISDLTKKFMCSLLLHTSVILGRNDNKCFPERLVENIVLQNRFNFILIITHAEFPKRLLEDVKLVLEKAMKPITLAFGRCTVAVWNPEMARNYGFKIEH